MQINYESGAEEAQFGEMVHSGSQLAELMGTFLLQLDCDSDYDTVTVSFDDEDTIRVVIEDSPYVVVFCDPEQCITLFMSDYGELTEDGQYDFDDDGVETLVDVIASRILTRDYDAE